MTIREGSTADGGLSLEAFFDAMSAQDPETLSHERLMELLGDLRLPAAHVERRVRFATDHYTRNLVCRTPEFELLVLCWRPGQRSTIHDHGGSLNAIKVHSGELTSRLYVPTAGTPPQARGPAVFSHDQVASAGGGVVGIDRDGMHQLANLTDDELVTIHLYAPPLLQLTVYREDAPETESLPLRYTLHEDLT